MWVVIAILDHVPNVDHDIGQGLSRPPVISKADSAVEVRVINRSVDGALRFSARVLIVQIYLDLMLCSDDRFLSSPVHGVAIQVIRDHVSVRRHCRTQRDNPNMPVSSEISLQALIISGQSAQS